MDNLTGSADIHPRAPVRTSALATSNPGVKVVVRLRVEVETPVKSIPWAKVLAPCRGVAYTMLGRFAPELARQLHQSGWGPHRMRPFGVGAPVFPGAPQIPGAYAAGGTGYVEFGSPLSGVVNAWVRYLLQVKTVSWGGIPLHVTGVVAVEPPAFEAGHAAFRTRTPVLMKPTAAQRGAAQSWVLPGEAGFADFFQQNLIGKAETLGLTPHASLESVTWIGPKRSFATGNGAKPGANIEVLLSGDPDVLRALWSWGLGQSNSEGFGWILWDA